MYFYSDFHENEKNLSRISKKLSEKRKDIEILLVNIDDPMNEELTDIYSVNTVPLLVFLTPGGEIAARRFLPLSAEGVVTQITEQIYKGNLPNLIVEEIRTRLLGSFQSVTKRNNLTEIIAEQIEEDLAEASLEKEIRDLVSSHISAINHTISDLQEFKRILQKYSRQQDDLII